MGSLLKALDSETAKKKVSLVVNFTGTPSDEYLDSIKEMVKKFELKNAAMTTSADGERFAVSKEADVTVMHYKGKRVQFNFAAKGEISKKEIEKVVEGLGTIAK